MPGDDLSLTGKDVGRPFKQKAPFECNSGLNTAMARCNRFHGWQP
jgi:hypothetical protein